MEQIEIFLKGIAFAILGLSAFRCYRSGDKISKIAGSIMLFWVIVIGSSMTKFFLSIDEAGLPLQTFTMLDLLLLPTFAFVTIALTNVKSLNFITVFLHEVPFLLIALIYIFADLDVCYTIGMAYGIIYTLAVFIYALVKISKYNAKIKEFYSDNDRRNLNWLNTLYWILFGFIIVCGASVFIAQDIYPIAASLISIVFWLFFDYHISCKSVVSLQTIVEKAGEEKRNTEEIQLAEDMITLQKSVDELRQLVSPYDYDQKKLHPEVNSQVSGVNIKAEKEQQATSKDGIISGVKTPKSHGDKTISGNNLSGTDSNEEKLKEEKESVKLPEKIEDLEVKDVSEERLQEIMDGLEQQPIDVPKTQVSSETKDVIDLSNQQNNQYPFVEELNRLCKEERIFLTPGLSIQDVVEKLGTNRTYLSNYLNKELNMTFYDFINEQRLDYAAMLLASTKINIEQIIFECGFQSKTTFHRVFANKFGCTPKQYRDRQ